MQSSAKTLRSPIKRSLSAGLVALLLALSGCVLPPQDGTSTRTTRPTTTTGRTTAATRPALEAPATKPATPAQEVPKQKPAPAPVAASASATTPPPAAPTLAAYVPQATVGGRLRSVGSDTMDHIVERWEKAFQVFHPRLRINHEGKGSSTAIPALIEGRADIGPMSRPVQEAESRRFSEALGHPPTQLRVASDALAIFVHPDNPLATRGLTLAELDAIFSETRSRGHERDVLRWGDLGLTGEWAAQPINLYSRNRASGSYGWFLDTVLKKGAFRTNIRELPGSAEVVAAVGLDRFGIGYSGVAFATESVRAVPLAAERNRPFVAPTEATALSGTYPLARGLFLALNLPPEGASPTLREFLGFVLSREGQEIVRAEGFYALRPEDAHAELAKVRAARP